MKKNPRILSFPSPSACFSPSGHSLSRGGMPMKVTHQHPVYASEKERLDRLQDLKKSCSIQLRGLNSSSRTA